MSEAGWNLKNGKMDLNNNYKEALSKFFSKNNKMNNFYKILLFKSLLEIEKTKGNVFNELVIIFSELYFNYKKDFPINICLYNGRSKDSAMDILIENFFRMEEVEYKNILEKQKVEYILEVKKIMKKNVIGAFYKSLNKLPYTFDLNLEVLNINYEFKEFIDQNKEIFEKLIFLRIIEFIKISEKDRSILEKEMIKKRILYYKQDLYINIQKIIDELFL